MKKPISPSDLPASSRPLRWGLAAKLFVILTLLGAVAVLVTGALGYVRARDALEEAVYNQLTAARQTKTHQVETYFRTVRAEMNVIAGSRMLIDAVHGFRGAIDELDAKEVPPDLRQKSLVWYDGQYMPTIRRLLAAETPPVKEFLPISSSTYFLQAWYMVDNPHPTDRRKLLDDAGDGSTYSKLHAVYHPIMRMMIASLKFYDLFLINPKTGQILYTVAKEPDFGTSLQTGPYRRSNLAAAAARCAEAPNPTATCVEDFTD